MPDQLRSIRTFKDLVRYLEAQLDWPLEEYGFDELTFDLELAAYFSDASIFHHRHYSHRL